MLRVRGIVEELNFERKVPIEIKVLGIATCIQTSVKDCKNSFRDSSGLENIRNGKEV